MALNECILADMSENERHLLNQVRSHVKENKNKKKNTICL